MKYQSPYITLGPAYHRDYSSKKEVLKDFNEDKDFIILDAAHPYAGAYVNKSQLVDDPVVTHVNIRYARSMKVLVVKVK